jgi:hypothetical protein
VFLQTARNLRTDAPVGSASGPVSVRAAGGMDLRANVSTGGAASMELVSGGTVSLSAVAQVSTAAGDLFVSAGGDLEIGGGLATS